jgi:hypothetical protein
MSLLGEPKAEVCRRLVGVFRQCLQVKHSTPAWSVYREVGCKPISFYWFRCVMKFYNSMVGSNSALLQRVFKADLKLASDGRACWAQDVLHVVADLGLPEQALLAMKQGTGEVDVERYATFWLRHAQQTVQSLSAGDPRVSDNPHRKLATYHNWFAVDRERIFEGRMPCYLRRGWHHRWVPAVTRFRLGSHHLEVEVGRFLRQQYSDRECHHCEMGVGDEAHVLCECPDWEDAREDLGLQHLSWMGWDVDINQQEIRGLWTDDDEDHDDRAMTLLGRYISQFMHSYDSWWRADSSTDDDDG